MEGGIRWLVARVSFVFTNPRHHLEMMVPVARELSRRGVACELVSLAEVRGIETPPAPSDLPLQRVLPFNLRRRMSIPTGKSEKTGLLRQAAQRIGWLGLAARMLPTLRRSEVVVVPNDAVFPYEQLIRELHRRGTPYVLMQEGIRFALPNSYAGSAYARGGAAAVCAWGQGSAEHFVASDVSSRSVVVTGTPRFDAIDPQAWTEKGKALLARLDIAPPIALLTNPIEIQGYGTRDDKHVLISRFLDEAAEILDARQIPVVVKCHAHEDPDELSRLFAKTRSARWVRVIPNEPLFEVLAASRAAIILTSTVGLEALLFGLPLGMLEIPGHQFAFEYVQRGAAVAIRAGAVTDALTQLVEPTAERTGAAAAFVERHLFDRGQASRHVADAITRMLNSRPS